MLCLGDAGPLTGEWGGSGTLKARGSKPVLAQAAMAKVSRKDSNSQVVGVSNKAAVGPPPCTEGGWWCLWECFLLQLLALSLPSGPLQDSCLELG